MNTVEWSRPRTTPMAGRRKATSRWCDPCQRLHATHRAVGGEEECPAVAAEREQRLAARFAGPAIPKPRAPRKRIRMSGAIGLGLLLFVVSLAEARDPAQVRAFRKTHPCPATGKVDGTCPGWVVDHMYPLCAGGQDDPSNMMWQEKEASFTKDRLERELCRLKKACPAP